MGTQPAMKTFLLFAATVALAFALDSDDIMPEADLVQIVMNEVDDFDGHQEAVKEIAMLQESGQGKNACLDLAKQTAKEVQNSVTQQQTLLNGFRSSKTCPTAGDSGVANAQKVLKGAKKDLNNKKKAASKAADAPVQFGTINLDVLSSDANSCNDFGGAAYRAARDAKNTADKAVTRAVGAVDAAERGLKKAKEQAVVDKSSCWCKFHMSFRKAWQAATTNKVLDSNKKAATKAAHMLCVLNGTPPAQCKVTIPTLTKPQLPSEARNRCTQYVQTIGSCPIAAKSCGFAGSTITSKTVCMTLLDKKVVSDNICRDWKHLTKPNKKTKTCAKTARCVVWQAGSAPGCTNRGCGSPAYTTRSTVRCIAAVGGASASEQECNNQKLTRPSPNTRSCAKGPSCYKWQKTGAPGCYDPGCRQPAFYRYGGVNCVKIATGSAVGSNYCANAGPKPTTMNSRYCNGGWPYKCANECVLSWDASSQCQSGSSYMTGFNNYCASTRRCSRL